MKKPNFFIVGAPKCGTTALSQYLKEHENIFMSTPKEPHFFADEFRKWFYKAENDLDYYNLFKDVKENHNAVGEASVLYLYSKNAIKKIYKFNPNSKIIVMLRNPVDLVYSWHSQAVFNTDETILDFKKAWDIQEKRKRGESIPRNCRIPETLFYRDVASIGTQIENLLSVFPEGQIKFILLEDFKFDTVGVYKNVLKFLNVEYDGRKDFPVINENKKHVNLKIARIKRNKIVILARRIKNYLGFENLAIMKRVYDSNIKYEKRKPLSNELRNELIQIFLPEIEKVENKIKIDLNHWKDA